MKIKLTHKKVFLASLYYKDEYFPLRGFRLRWNEEKESFSQKIREFHSISFNSFLEHFNELLDFGFYDEIEKEDEIEQSKEWEGNNEYVQVTLIEKKIRKIKLYQNKLYLAEPDAMNKLYMSYTSEDKGYQKLAYNLVGPLLKNFSSQKGLQI